MTLLWSEPDVYGLSKHHYVFSIWRPEQFSVGSAIAEPTSAGILCYLFTA